MQQNGTVTYNDSIVTMTGVVEVCANGIWVSVCDLYPVDPIFPELVCQTLGYRGKNIILLDFNGITDKCRW